MRSPWRSGDRGQQRAGDGAWHPLRGGHRGRRRAGRWCDGGQGQRRGLGLRRGLSGGGDGVTGGLGLECVDSIVVDDCRNFQQNVGKKNLGTLFICIQSTIFFSHTKPASASQQYFSLTNHNKSAPATPNTARIGGLCSMRCCYLLPVCRPWCCDGGP